MDLTVYLNGEFVKSEAAKVSIYDHGFLYGDSIFETLQIYNKHIFQFHEHMDRFFESARQIYLEVPLIRSVIEKAIRILLDQNGLEDAIVRIMLTRGEGAIGIDIEQCPTPTFLITAYPKNPLAAKHYQNGVALVLSSHRKIPPQCLDSNIKSGNYLPMIIAREEAKRRGAFDALFLNIEGYITECTTSNLFIVKEGRFLTPDFSCGILPGVTRKTVMQLAEALHKEAFETFLAPEDLVHAEEAFICNSVFEILPVTAYEKKPIAHGRPGKLTQSLIQEFQTYVRHQTKK